MDSTTEVTHTGCLGNFFNSIVGAILGIVLFFGAFPLIWFGEGRTNLAQVAATSVIASSHQVDPANNAHLIAVTGAVEADAVGDPPYLNKGAYLRLERVAEMYAWVEHKHTSSQRTAGGGRRTETTYSYSKEWTSHPERSSSFHNAQGHQNPTMTLESRTVSGTNGQLDAYDLDLQHLDLPSMDELALSSAMIGNDTKARLSGNYLFMGTGSLNTPNIGDTRISYRALPTGTTLTVFGNQQNNQIIAYSNAKGDRLFRAFKGDRAAAIQQLQTEDTIMDWAFRIGALLMMWIGLSMGLGPINAAFGILPFMDQAAGCMIGVITFLVALPIWGVTVLIAVVAHNIWLLAAVIGLIIGIAFVGIGMKKLRSA